MWLKIFLLALQIFIIELLQLFVAHILELVNRVTVILVYPFLDIFGTNLAQQFLAFAIFLGLFVATHELLVKFTELFVAHILELVDAAKTHNVFKPFHRLFSSECVQHSFAVNLFLFVVFRFLISTIELLVHLTEIFVAHILELVDAAKTHNVFKPFHRLFGSKRIHHSLTANFCFATFCGSFIKINNLFNS